MAFIVGEPEQPAIEVCVNFGVFAGRDATRAELDRLAAWLLDEVGEVSIISEERLETDGSAEASGTRSGSRSRTVKAIAMRWPNGSSSGPSTRLSRAAERHAEIADDV